MKRAFFLSAMTLLCVLGHVVASLAEDPSIKTGENQDTLLYVRTVPAGAKILLDDKEIGTSDGVFSVGPGVGTVLVELEGYKPNAKQVTIRADGITRVVLELKQDGSNGNKNESEKTVVEGIGWGDFKIGATRDEMIKAIGPFEPNSNLSSVRRGWLSKHHIDCFFDQQDRAAEVRFVKGFKLPLASGVKIGSSEKEALLAYGAPDFVRNNRQAKMLGYGKPGVLMWLMNGKVTSFTVTKPHRTNYSATSSGGNASQLSQQGWTLWKEQRWDEAIAKFRQAVQLAPKNEAALNGLGWASFNSGKRREAEKAFTQLIKLNPNHPAALNGLGQLYLAEKKYDQAEKYLLKAAKRRASAAWFGLARLYLLQGKFDQAKKYAEMIVDSGQGNKVAEKMLQAAKEKRLGDGLRMMIEPQPVKIQPAADEKNADAKQKAVEAAEAWLALVDHGKYEQSWETAAGHLKNVVSKKNLVNSLDGVRKPLGKLVSRKLKSAQYKTSLPGAPNGEYVVLQYETSFADKTSATETVTPMLDKDKKWKVSGYYIK